MRTLILSTSILAAHAGAANAALLIQPLSVSSATALFGTYQLTNMINQDGLSQAYVSGFTDYATYMASSPTQASNPLTQYAVMSETANVTYDFDLGTAHNVTNIILWNAPASASTRISSFSVQVSDSPTFAASVNVGSFNSSPSAAHPVAAEGFSFASTTGRYVRVVTTNAGGTRTLVGEIAFAGTAVPEPSSAVLCALGTVGVLLRRRR